MEKDESHMKKRGDVKRVGARGGKHEGGGGGRRGNSMVGWCGGEEWVAMEWKWVIKNGSGVEWGSGKWSGTVVLSFCTEGRQGVECEWERSRVGSVRVHGM